MTTTQRLPPKQDEREPQTNRPDQTNKINTRRGQPEGDRGDVVDQGVERDEGEEVEDTERQVRVIVSKVSEVR